MVEGATWSFALRRKATRLGMIERTLQVLAVGEEAAGTFGRDRLRSWPGWRSTGASPADVSEGTVWFGAPGVVFTVWMDEKAFIPKLTAGKCSLKKERKKEDILLKERIE